MKGTHTLRIRSVHLSYEITVSRNITILQGNSATGKTTLVEMVQEYLLNGTDTGITLSCDCPCRVIAGNTWKEQLAGVSGSIVFIDEGSRFVSSTEFAEAIRGSDNYYVIVTREALDNLPYSVTEIYGIRSSGKYNMAEPVYHHMYRIYGDGKLNTVQAEPPSTIITEDSNSGYEFFSALAEKAGLSCFYAGGASRIFELLQEMKGSVTVIADGAAFGSQMARIYQTVCRKSGIRLYLPESFEWIILASDVLSDNEVRAILKNPADYIDSKTYFSWERFFTSLLVSKSNDTWLKYNKSELNPVYLKGKCKEDVLAVLPQELRDMLRQA